MRISIEYVGKDGNIHIMNIEHNDSKYQLYISNDYYLAKEQFFNESVSLLFCHKIIKNNFI